MSPVADLPISSRQPAVVPELKSSARGMDRRRFLGYVLAAPTLVVAARLVADDAAPQLAAAAIPSLPEVSDLYDLGDLQDLAASATSSLISITVNSDGTASFALPRAEVGQGITTSIAMIIADEMDLPLSDVIVTLADARPELLFNQLTGGSNTTRSLYQAVRVAAATARARLMTAAATKWGVPVSALTAKNGVITSSTGTTATYGSLATAAAATQASSLSVQLKSTSDFTLIGTPQNRTDALASVTGTKVFTMDVDVPNALPTMVCRPPTINGTVHVGGQPGRGQEHARHHRRGAHLHRRGGAGARPSASASTRSTP